MGLRFSISQNIENVKILNRICAFLNCGSVYKALIRNSEEFKSNKFSEIWNLIIPLLKENSILVTKSLDFNNFVQAAELMKDKLI